MVVEAPALAITIEHPELRTPREKAQHYLGDLVYGANDGIITTFAVVAGVAGADLSTRIVLILGVANLVADGFSMAASNVLAIRAKTSIERTSTGVITEPYAVRHGLATFAAFIVAGAVPLLAYLFHGNPAERFRITTFLTLSTLFIVGALRGLISGEKWWVGGLEMLGIGALAAWVAWYAGRLLAGFNLPA